LGILIVWSFPLPLKKKTIMIELDPNLKKKTKHTPKELRLPKRIGNKMNMNT